MPYMLEMRKNMVHYVQLIDAYAPCVVSSRAWNNEANMAAYCGSNNRLFEQHVLSISDEAFMLVVLVNYSTRKRNMSTTSKRYATSMVYVVHV